MGNGGLGQLQLGLDVTGAHAFVEVQCAAGRVLEHGQDSQSVRIGKRFEPDRSSVNSGDGLSSHIDMYLYQCILITVNMILR
ncbi:MAG: hypothetical protein JWO13_902 [Acidobacteriales bacterium]|nr:hypothetical protein [Terriglobales bacterium]